MWPLIVLADQDLYTLPVALAALSREHVQDNELMMAGSVVTVLPVLTLFSPSSANISTGCSRAASRDEAPRDPRRACLSARRRAALVRRRDGRRLALARRRFGQRRRIEPRGPRRDGKAVEMRYDYRPRVGLCLHAARGGVTLPRNYEIRFRMRGSGGRNDMQMKLTHGDNVWWKVWRNERPSAAWQEVVVPAAEIGFAWGPTTDKNLRRADGIEFVVARNRDGGRGSIAIDDLRIVALPGAPAAPPPPDAKVNDALAALAKASPRGAFPRAFIGEQPYWTLAGSDGGKVGALIGEDAAIEPAKGSYSIEPVVIDGGKRFDWANVDRAQRSPTASCRSVGRWTAPQFRLTTTLLADSAGRAVLAGYELTNSGPARRTIELRLGVRPWQVNPPAQFLAQQGGHSPISNIVRDGRALRIAQPQTEGDPPITRTLALVAPADRGDVGAARKSRRRSGPGRPRLSLRPRPRQKRAHRPGR